MDNKPKIVKKRNIPEAHDMSLGKLPPQAVDIEEAILGAVLLEKDAVYTALEILQPESFYKDAHKEIFQAITKLFNDSQPIDILTVTNQLRKEGKIEIVGGAYYISELTSKVSSAANLETHARIVSEKAIKRGLIRLASHIHKDAYEDTTDVFDLMDQTELEFMNLGLGSIREGAVSVGDTSDEVFKRMFELASNKDKGKLTGVPSGFIEMDRITSGWQGGHLIIVAARPSMGKSAYCTQLAINAVKFNKPILIFSLEMSRDEVVTRIMSSETKIELHKIRNGDLEDHELEALNQYKANVENMPIYIDDSALKLIHIRSEAILMKRKKGIEMIIVDYLQLMEGNAETREQEVARISRGLKRLAKELNIPVIALSQLSRAVETRGGEKRPQLSDLRESGAIEQDADMVIFLYRPEYYGITQNESGESLIGICESIIAKHRNGSLAEIPLRFEGKYTRFEDLQPDFVQPDHMNENSFPGDGLQDFTTPNYEI